MFFERFRKRYIILAVAVVVLAVVFFTRLLSLQVVQGEAYLAQSERKIYRGIPIPASRGEILDRYGRPLVTNSQAFTVIIDRIYLPERIQNETILRLCNLFVDKGAGYNDGLPVTEPPFTYNVSEEKDSAGFLRLTKLLESRELPPGTTAPELMDRLIQDYKLAEYSLEDARKVAGVRYEMERQGYSLTTPMIFAQDVSMDMVTRVREGHLDLPGVNVSVETVREFAAGTMAAHILGRVGRIFKEEYEEYKSKGYAMNDIVGKDGIEKAMEDWLKGTAGLRSIEQNVVGKVTGVLAEEEPVPGNNVLLTIDAKMQRVAEDSLERTIKKIAENASRTKRSGWDASAGAVAVVEIGTGDILTLASYPTYEPAYFNRDYWQLYEDPLKPMFNRAIAGTYAPGSTFKMATALAALESGVITPSSTISCRGVYEYYAPSYRPRCWVYTDYGRTHGPLNVQGAIRVSCNYFFYEVSRLMGIDNLNKYTRLLGLGDYTGIEIAGESAGILAGPDYRSQNGRQWYPGDTLQAGIGQSDNLFTPLQLANYLATLAGGGARYETHLLKSVKTYHSGETIYRSEPNILSDIEMDSTTYDVIMAGMRSVTEDGTASNVFGNYPIAVGGKTGTAQVPSGSANGVFLAFAPFDNPKIAVAIVVEHGAHGNTVAPIARDIFDEYFRGSAVSEKIVPEKELIQ